MSNSADSTVAVLGTGNVGRTLAAAWVKAGRTVTIAGRDATRTREAAQACGATAATPLDAVAGADIVVVAVPSTGLDDAATTLAHARPGALVVDATNGRVDGRPTPVSARAALEAAAPHGIYVRAFNSTAWENMENPVLDGRPVDLLWCGPEGADGARAEALIRDVGMRPVRVGDSATTEQLDALTALWFTLVFARGHGRRIAFTVAGLQGDDPQ
jgi:predicted dinucleotide-binding enzyme